VARCARGGGAAAISLMFAGAHFHQTRKNGTGKRASALNSSKVDWADRTAAGGERRSVENRIEGVDAGRITCGQE